MFQKGALLNKKDSQVAIAPSIHPATTLHSNAKSARKLKKLAIEAVSRHFSITNPKINFETT